MEKLFKEIESFSNKLLVAFLYGIIVQNIDDDFVIELAFKACWELRKRFDMEE